MVNMIILITGQELHEHVRRKKGVFRRACFTGEKTEIVSHQDQVELMSGHFAEHVKFFQKYARFLKNSENCLYL